MRHRVCAFQRALPGRVVGQCGQRGIEFGGRHEQRLRPGIEGGARGRVVMRVGRQRQVVCGVAGGAGKAEGLFGFGNQIGQRSSVVARLGRFDRGHTVALAHQPATGVAAQGIGQQVADEGRHHVQ